MNMIFSLVLAGTYFLASFSSAIWVCKLFRLPDPRTAGSKNPGTTNVLRIGGRIPAFLTLLGDALKGFVPTVLTQYFLQDPLSTGLVALMAVLGHCFPLYYRFEGGKGVATAIGCAFGIYWGMGAIFVSVWLLIAGVFRYSSLAAIIALFSLPISGYFLISPMISLPLGMMIALILVRHRQNILRLWQGTEPKIGQRPAG